MSADENTRENSDVTMRGFATRTSVNDAVLWIDRRAEALDSVSVSLDDAAGRVLAAPVVSSVNVPNFERSMMDGYAVIAEDTHGAGDYNRLNVTVIGESLPAAPFRGDVKRGQAVRVMTGAPMPPGASAVLPVEWVELQGDRLLVSSDVATGKHVGTVAEDIAEGETVFLPGRRLRPQDLGVLSSIGQTDVIVVRRPRVRVVVTGNELLASGSKPSEYRIADANSPMLKALVKRDGGDPLFAGITPDDPAQIEQAIREESSDVVLISGGSSVGQEDHAPAILKRIGELAIHGIAMRPSSPAGMGSVAGKLVFLLPGNPVSCLCAYDFFAGRAIRTLAGLPKQWPYRLTKKSLARKISSIVGRLDYSRVRLCGDQKVEPIAIGGASVLSSTTRADGFVIISPESEGFPAGSDVSVNLYD